MGKKCVPGLICIENMTLFMLAIIIMLIVYIWHNHSRKESALRSGPAEKIVLVNTGHGVESPAKRKHCSEMELFAC